MSNTLDLLAARLNQALEAASITQSKLGQIIGASQPAVSQWLTGKKASTSDNLEALARTLRVNREWLATGAGRMRAADPVADRDEYRGHAVWEFRPAPRDGGKDFGNANVWSFDPGLDVLVREVLQNARDAAPSADRKVEVAFRIIRLADADKQDYLAALGWPDLVRHLDASAESGQKLGTLLRDGLDRLAEEELLLLAIEDGGTVGLTGPERSKGNFTALCRNNLDSNKDGTKGGAFGLGKAVLWRASRLSIVMFCSHLSQPVDGKSQFRTIGRCELAWHRVGRDEYAGPGWFGRRDAEHGTAESFWDNETLARDLYLDREGSGTTACVVGFHDASADRDRTPTDLAQDLVRAAAENFFPALVCRQPSIDG